MNARGSVDGWRWDFLTPWGWLPSSATKSLLTGRPAESEGWHYVERAVCLIADHRAPDPDCACGVHAVEHLTPTVADRLDDLDAQRTAAIEDGRVDHPDLLVVTLSRVRLTEVLPTAWPDDAEALAAHPDAVPDPPYTIRAHRREYLEVWVDREWPDDPAAMRADPRFKDFPPFRYRPDLAGWVRRECAAQLDAYLDAALGGGQA